jgi:putative RecB family exonuclease
LAEAGYAKGLTLTARVQLAGATEAAAIYQKIAADLADAGVKLELRPVQGPEWVRMYTTGEWGDADIISSTWNAASYHDTIRAIETYSCRKPGAFFCAPELEPLITSKKEWMDRAESLLETYFNLEDPTSFDSTYRELHLEKDFTDQIYLHGYVDRLDIAPTGEVRIVDYKTGKSPKPAWEEKALFQLRVYALLYWRNEGVLPRLLQLLYLGDGRTVKSSPTERELEATERILKNIGDEILTAIETDFFPTKKSRLCDWCSFKSICPAHN